MPFVVTDNCVGCRFTYCVSVCPVDCFHGDEQMLYIDPGVCIDCGACEPQCPVHAIDMVDTICGPQLCPAVVGNIIVWRDNHHLTASYSLALAPYLAPKLGI